jgi:hypothetical protein
MQWVSWQGTPAKNLYFSTAGPTIPAFAGLRSLTSTKDSENAPCQEHYRNNCSEIQVERVYQRASLMFSHPA